MVRPVWSQDARFAAGPMLGLALQLLLLVALAKTVGLGVAAWLVTFSYGLVTCLALLRALRRGSPAGTLGPADWVTLTRATLVGAVAALTVEALGSAVPVWPLVALASVALALDAVDGQVARRTGSASPLGARFDMETDAFLILVLSVHVGQSLGAWVLTIGLMRYAYVAAGWALPWLRGPVPPRYWRKVVAATQGIVLTAVASNLFPGWLQVTAVAAALALLVESFGRDVLWLSTVGTSGAIGGRPRGDVRAHPGAGQG